jgi:putative FmdB family regulatory protein
MPIYEYGCYDCRKRVSVFFRSFTAAETQQAHCPRCGGTNIKRLVSKVAVVRSEESRLDSLADPSNFSGLDENDPKSIGRWMRKMGSELGEDMGSDFDEMVGRLEAGEDPEEIEKSMPDLGGGGGGGASDDWFGD